MTKNVLHMLNIENFLHTKDLSLEGRILDTGCVGSITNALDIIKGKNSNVGSTHGIDISEDGIAVAKKNIPNCHFFQQSVDDLSNFENGYFDIIHCREFYPFTRTNSKNTYEIF